MKQENTLKSNITDRTIQNIDPANLHHFLQEMRIRAGLNQSQLAKKMNVARQYISRTEKDKKNLCIDTIVKWAAACGFLTRISFWS